MLCVSSRWTHHANFFLHSLGKENSLSRSCPRSNLFFCKNYTKWIILPLVLGNRYISIYRNWWNYRFDTFCKLPNLDVLWTGNGFLVNFTTDTEKHSSPLQSIIIENFIQYFFKYTMNFRCQRLSQFL